MTTTNEKLSALVDDYQNAWNKMDFEKMATLWDQSEAEIYYVAEEMEQPLYQFDEVRDYWAFTDSVVNSVKMQLSDRHCKLLTSELAVVTFQMHIDMSLPGLDQRKDTLIGNDLRVSAILRNKNKQWRFIHYVEAALGALPFIRRVYQQNVRAQ